MSVVDHLAILFDNIHKVCNETLTQQREQAVMIFRQEADIDKYQEKLLTTERSLYDLNSVCNNLKTQLKQSLAKSD